MLLYISTRKGEMPHVRNNQTLEEISEIVGLDLDALRELKKSI